MVFQVIIASIITQVVILTVTVMRIVTNIVTMLTFIIDKMP